MKKPLAYGIIFALLGAAYSGTLAFNKLTTGICPFGASCPYLFGIPVCVFGFIGFAVTLFLLGGIYTTKDMKKAYSLGNIVYWISFIGILFALYFLIQELFYIGPPGGKFQITLGYPSCLYGLIGFSVVFSVIRRVLVRTQEDMERSEQQQT